MVPTRTGKPGKTGEHFSVKEKSGNFAKTGKAREFYPKYWKIRKNNTGKVREICQSEEVGTMVMVPHRIKHFLMA